MHARQPKERSKETPFGTNMNAPFGNQFTPLLRTRIVGGLVTTSLEDTRGISSPEPDLPPPDDATNDGALTPRTRLQLSRDKDRPAAGINSQTLGLARFTSRKYALRAHWFS